MKTGTTLNISKETARQLMLLKITLKLKNINALIEEMIKVYEKRK